MSDINDIAPEFRIIDGIGPAIESRLHAAGVETWHALAEVAAAFATMKGVSAHQLRTIARTASEHAAGAVPAPTGQHVESFVVRVALDDDNMPLRTHAVDARTSETATWSGWDPEGLEGFMATHAGISSHEMTSSTHVALIPVGRVVGGRHRNVGASLDVEPDHAGSGFRAELTGRAIGTRAGSIGPLGVRTGRVPEAGRLDLSFDDVALPPGVIDLTVIMELHPTRA